VPVAPFEKSLNEFIRAGGGNPVRVINSIVATINATTDDKRRNEYLIKMLHRAHPDIMSNTDILKFLFPDPMIDGNSVIHHMLYSSIPNNVTNKVTNIIKCINIILDIYSSDLILDIYSSDEADGADVTAVAAADADADAKAEDVTYLKNWSDRDQLTILNSKYNDTTIEYLLTQIPPKKLTNDDKQQILTKCFKVVKTLEELQQTLKDDRDAYGSYISTMVREKNGEEYRKYIESINGSKGIEAEQQKCGLIRYDTYNMRIHRIINAITQEKPNLIYAKYLVRGLGRYMRAFSRLADPWLKGVEIVYRGLRERFYDSYHKLIEAIDAEMLGAPGGDTSTGRLTSVLTNFKTSSMGIDRYEHYYRSDSKVSPVYVSGFFKDDEWF